MLSVHLQATDHPFASHLVRYAICDASGVEIASVGRADSEPIEARKTATLFAAAPELLNACKAVLRREDVASSELGDVLRKAITIAEPPTPKPIVRPLVVR